MNLSKITSAVILAAASTASSLVPAVNAAPPARPYGDAKVLATFPTPPGFPEGIAVKGNKVYVSGPARFGTAGTAVLFTGQPRKAASSFASSSDVLKSPEAAMMKPPGWKYFW